MNVDYELLQRGCDRAREIRLMQERILEDTPERKAHKLEVQTMWRHMKRAMRLNGEHTLWLMGGVVKVNMGRAA